jgi:hypothetical protein
MFRKLDLFPSSGEPLQVIGNKVHNDETLAE